MEGGETGGLLASNIEYAMAEEIVILLHSCLVLVLSLYGLIAQLFIAPFCIFVQIATTS